MRPLVAQIVDAHTHTCSGGFSKYHEEELARGELCQDFEACEYSSDVRRYLSRIHGNTASSSPPPPRGVRLSGGRPSRCRPASRTKPPTPSAAADHFNHHVQYG